MKIQDIFFILVFILLVLPRKPKILAIAGLVCLLFAIPLFATWIFFTAERLTWYAGAFFLSSTVLLLWQEIKERK